MTKQEERGERLVMALYQLMQAMKSDMEQCCVSCGGLNEKEFLLINHVGQMKNVKMSALADVLSAPMSTITSIVDKLVEKKYLDRYHSNEDRRVILVTLASNGQETFDFCSAHKISSSQKVLKHYTEKEQDQFIEYLEKLPSILKEE